MVEPTHLLLGLLRLEHPVSALLQAEGASLKTWRAQLQHHAQTDAPASGGSPADAPAISPSSRSVMERAARYAQQQHEQITAPKHVLLALLASQADDPQVQQLLSALPGRGDHLRQAVQTQASAVLHRRAPQPSPKADQVMVNMLKDAQNGTLPPGMSRAELLGLVLNSASPAVLPELEPVLYNWLTTWGLSPDEKHLLLHQLLRLALHRQSPA